MNKEQQVKTIMEIFDGLTNVDQVELFVEVKSLLLTQRKNRENSIIEQRAGLENYHKELVCGNEVIHGTATTAR